jgi:hypothetical protein
MVGDAGFYAELFGGGAVSPGLPRICTKQAHSVSELRFIIGKGSFESWHEN